MQLTNISDYIQDALIDMRYTTDNNIIGRPISDELEPRLVPSAALALGRVADDLRDQGYRLVIWDAYRTPDVQKLLVNDVHDQRYVLLESKHCLGLALDLTLALLDGELLDMGTDHDDFTELAHVDTDDIREEQQYNRQLLAQAMQRQGFEQWPYEWWHFDYEQ